VTATAILDLEKAGFSREQVEALARWHEAGIDLSHLTTKADLAEVRREIADAKAELPAEIAGVRHEMAAGKADLLKWMFGIAAGQLGLLIAVLKLFPGGHP
jgi:hypothetical protein